MDRYKFRWIVGLIDLLQMYLNVQNLRVHQQSCGSVLCQRIAREREEVAHSWSFIHSVSKSLSLYIFTAVCVHQFWNHFCFQALLSPEESLDIWMPGPEEMGNNWVHWALLLLTRFALNLLSLPFVSFIFLFFCFHKSDPLKMFDVSFFFMFVIHQDYVPCPNIASLFSNKIHFFFLCSTSIGYWVTK